MSPKSTSQSQFMSPVYSRCESTDVSERAIESAQAGIYPESIAGDVSPDRLRQFFRKVGGGYQLDKAIRDLGGKHWQNVHRLGYVAAVLAVAHHYMQSKVNVSEPVVMTGLLVWLFGYRLLASGNRGQTVSLARLVILGLFAALLAALGEADYYELFTGISGTRVIDAYMIPPSR